jgi:dolichyl-phosphate beta-glucosyltransferase
MTKNLPTLSIVLPVFNERNRIVSGLEKAFVLQNQWVGNCDILLVDDGSTDNSLDMVQQFKDQITILSIPHLGKGGAVQKGMLEASGDWVVFSDIDWSVPVEQVFAMISTPADIVIASREVVGARRIAEPPWRHILGKFFNRWVQWMLISGYEDTQCGCKVFSQKASQSIFSKTQENGWAFDVEVLVLAHLMGFQVKEYPVSWHYQSNSKIKVFSDGIRMAKAILRIKKRLLERTYS